MDNHQTIVVAIIRFLLLMLYDLLYIYIYIETCARTSIAQIQRNYQIKVSRVKYQEGPYSKPNNNNNSNNSSATVQNSNNNNNNNPLHLNNVVIRTSDYDASPMRNNAKNIYTDNTQIPTFPPVLSSKYIPSSLFFPFPSFFYKSICQPMKDDTFSLF